MDWTVDMTNLWITNGEHVDERWGRFGCRHHTWGLRQLGAGQVLVCKNDETQILRPGRKAIVHLVVLINMMSEVKNHDNY